MTWVLRVLVAVAAVEALTIVAVYIRSDWRRDKTGWFLMALGGSIAWMVLLSVLRWWWHLPPVLWLPGVVTFDAALGMWVWLMLRRRIRKVEEDQ